MNNKFYLSTIVSLLLLHPGFISEAKEPAEIRKLSFDQALQIMQQNSHTLKQAYYLQKQKDQEVDAARSLYFPNIGITADYVAMSDPIQLDLNSVKDAIVPVYQALSKYGKFGDMPGLSDDIAT